jgi:hypothetical protein
MRKKLSLCQKDMNVVHAIDSISRIIKDYQITLDSLQDVYGDSQVKQNSKLRQRVLVRKAIMDLQTVRAILRGLHE